MSRHDLISRVEFGLRSGTMRSERRDARQALKELEADCLAREAENGLLREALRQIADPEIYDADWRAMRSIAHQALQENAPKEGAEA